jgi:hypothetical protein
MRDERRIRSSDIPEPRGCENFRSKILKFSYSSNYRVLCYDFNGILLNAEGMKANDH